MSWFQKLFRNTDADAGTKARTNVWDDRYFETLNTIMAMPLEEARQQAELLLTDPQKFDCVSSPSTKSLDILAPELQALFARFEVIQVVDDEAFLSRDSIAPFDMDGNGLSWGQPLWYIGQTDGHSVTMVKPHEELVYATADGENTAPTDPYPSVYHWLLWVSAVALDFGLD